MSLETLRHMVAAGAGYTLLPSIAVGKKPPLSKLIRYISLAGDRRYVRRIVMAWRRSYSRADDLALFADLIRSVAPESRQRSTTGKL
jgi:LysR family hydrogen peroxide-inducible transcriptional activator